MIMLLWLLAIASWVVLLCSLGSVFRLLSSSLHTFSSPVLFSAFHNPFSFFQLFLEFFEAVSKNFEISWNLLKGIAGYVNLDNSWLSSDHLLGAINGPSLL